MASIANAGLVLTVNGLDPTKEPIEIEAGQTVTIGLSGEAETKEGVYDLSITASGGTLERVSVTAAKESADSSEVHIVTSDLGSIDDILLEFDNKPGIVTLNLITNEDIIVDGIEAPAGTIIYELVLFELEETKTVVVFGINYEALSYTPPPAEQDDTEQEIAIIAISEIGIDGGGSPPMLMGTGWPQDPIWFDNPAECPDLDNDDFVNFVDFAIFAGNWLKTGDKLPGDFDENGTVDANDLGHLCEYWLTPVDCPDYEFPYITSFEEYQGFESGDFD